MRRGGGLSGDDPARCQTQEDGDQRPIGAADSLRGAGWFDRRHFASLAEFKRMSHCRDTKWLLLCNVRGEERKLPRASDQGFVL